MTEWLTLQEFAALTSGALATGCRMKIDGREGTVTVDPVFGTNPAVKFDGTEEHALNITDSRREILVHHTAVEHTNGIKETSHEKI